MKGKGLPNGVTPEMAKQSRDRSGSSSRANAAAEGGGETRRRTRGRDRTQSDGTERGNPPSQPPR
eukprot:12611029-Alexandrium_andersonii.AAC.1